MITKTNLIILSFYLFINLFVWTIQSNLLLNGDVSWLSFAAKKLIHGGQYGTDFLETNPPLIIYLYVPLLYLHQYLYLNELSSLLIYVFILSGISISLSYSLLNKIIFKEHYYLKLLIILILCILFLIIPVSEFGQREHLAVLFCTPYYFLLASRLNKVKVSTKLTAMVGIFAGIGFALKPYFYLSFILAELFYSYCKRNPFAFRRTEFYLISLIGCLYLNIILLFNFNYIYIIVPLIAHSYYPKYQLAFKYILLNDQSIYGYFLLIFYLFFHKHISYPRLIQTLLIAFLGFWLVFLWQKMGWIYHALPFFIYANLIYFLLYIEIICTKKIARMDYFKLTIFNILLMSYYFLYIPHITLNAYYFPSAFLLLFTSVFSLFIFTIHSKKKKFLLTLIIMLIINIIFYYYVSITILNHYLIFLSVIMWFLCFLLWIPESKLRYGYLALTGILIFSFPFYKTIYILNYSQYYKNLYQHMIKDTEDFEKHKVYFFSSSSELIFPLIDYAKLEYASRFWSMVWLPIMKNPAAENYHLFYQMHQKEIDFYIGYILEDFIKNKPDIIFVDTRTKGYFFNIPIDYILLFSENKSFKNLWKEYKFVKNINYPPLYKFSVYEKTDTMHIM